MNPIINIKTVAQGVVDFGSNRWSSHIPIKTLTTTLDANVIPADRPEPILAATFILF